ncbi:restriction endonuclease subunit S [Mediterranea massiliensis]|uniref:restriction endonuclease subunit S n=1 Tax=Mediterranea massiliensis TaxID=1841865 RepID=UPI0025A45D5C|nr:restriction endonuclease subunit S [Mediterranea massiliensis]MDM8337697.1 restriction endonuclease subunit S [Mediterranea massiliensis]
MGIVKFGDVVERINIKVDQSNPQLNYMEHGRRIIIPIKYYVGGEHIEGSEFMVHKKALIQGSTIGYQFQFGFRKGDILFMTKNPHLRKASMVDFDGLCSIATFVIASKSNNLLQNYLLLEMQSDRFWQYCEDNKSGGVNYFINWGTLSNYEFDLPPIEKQKELADKLWAAYRLKEGYKRLLAAIDEMVKSQFIEMLFKKPITGKIGDLVDKKIFSVKKIHSMNDIIEYIDISSVERSNHSIVETTSYVVSNAPSRAQQCVRLDDILVSTVRPINRNIAVVNSDKNNLVASTGFCVLRPKLAFKEYLLAIVQSDKYTEAMIDKASGGLYPAVNNGDVLNYGIYIPDEEFAKKFSLIYQQADKSKFELKQCIENIDKVIKSLING